MRRPPFKLTPTILQLATKIGIFVGRYEGLESPTPQPKLRRENRIRTIQSSVAIEGNTLSLDQVTSILDGQRVVGSPREILEVQNAVRAYELAGTFDAFAVKDLLKAHGVLTAGLVGDPGRWRQGNVGVIAGSRVAHVAPKPNLVPKLMTDLFAFLRKDDETPLLVRACIFHYELEFIHPFTDGNGRIGRLWQQVILRHVSPIFTFAPVESVIKDRQKDYYKALRAADKAGESTAFIEFSLHALADSLEEVLGALRPRQDRPEDRLNKAREHFGSKEFSRKEYLALFPAISTATASRDLALGVEQRFLRRTGDKAKARYRSL